MAKQREYFGEKEHTTAMLIDISLIGAVKNVHSKINASETMLCVRGLIKN